MPFSRAINVSSIQAVRYDGWLVQMNIKKLVSDGSVSQIEEDGSVFADARSLRPQKEKMILNILDQDSWYFLLDQTVDSSKPGQLML